MSDFNFGTKYITAIVEFDYDSKETQSKYTSNNVRESFLGLEKGSPKIPKILMEKCDYDRDIIFPVHFSLIKKPIKAQIPGKDKPYTIRNTAVGAMILYEYLGLPEHFKKCYKEFSDLLKKMIKEKKPKYYKYITNKKLLIGFDVKNE